MAIRNACKAIILDDGKILLNRCENSIGDACYGLSRGGVYYDFPGGGQNQYETLEEAVRRECLEETGYMVKVERLAGIFEEISMNERFRAKYPDYAHKVFFVFICRLAGEPLAEPSDKDLDMVAPEWVKVGDAKNAAIMPPAIGRNLETLIETDTPLFLGSVRV